jgi:hypothetical protein
MKQKIDIMKAKAVAEHQFLSPFVLKIHNPGSPTSEDDPYYKNNKYLKVFHRVKPPRGSYKTVYMKSGKISQSCLN